MYVKGTVNNISNALRETTLLHINLEFHNDFLRTLRPSSQNEKNP